MLKPLSQRFRELCLPTFRIAMYHQGKYYQEDMTPVSSCCNCYSISKNFTATAVGIAQDKGLLSVEDPILDYLQDYLPAVYDEKLAKVRIKHLLRHTMGMDSGFLFESDRYTYPTDDWIGLCLSRELKFEPGEHFAYSNSTYYLLSCIVEKVSGLPMNLFLQQSLFSALHFEGYAWECCPKGHTMGATGLYLRIADLVKFGQLYLQQGIWEGKRVLSEDWVREATARRVGQPKELYGYSFWLTEGSDYEGNGAYNQLLHIAPKADTVVGVHAFHDYKEMDLIVKDFIYSL